MAAPTVSPGAFALCEADLALATDLYQLTMAAVYSARRPLPRASFELFVRRLPARRNFLVSAGLEQALASLMALRFGPEHLAYLRGLPAFAALPEEFFTALGEFRFRGEVWAMPEGTIFFPGEPVVRVTGSLLEAQVVETLLLSVFNFQTAIASKAARVRLAAGDRVQLAEFGGRRAHGPQAASWVARAAYLGGFDSTSNVLAGMRAGVPVVGTMAHSFVMSYDDECEAFEAYRRVFPRHTILLVDTYDSLDGVRKAAALPGAFAGIRLDSGDLGALAREARRILDAAGRREVRIFASGDLDEDRIAALLAGGAPIDAFGVGTRLATAADAPYVGGIYKLVEIEQGGRSLPRLKLSAGKATYPGKKQVVRGWEAGRMRGDRVMPLAEAGDGPSETHLLRPVMRDGELLQAEELAVARQRVRRQLAALPPDLRSLGAALPGAYPVEVAASLEQAQAVELERVRAG